MAVFFFALIAVAAAAMGGRETVRVARLSAALGASAWLVLACWTACVAACLLAAQAGGWIGARLDSDGRSLAAAFAFALAALDLAFRRPGKPPAEPTRSFGAIVLVLGTAQLTSTTGLLVFAVTLATDAASLAAGGGVLGAGGVLTRAWHAGARWEAGRLPHIARFGVAILLLATALVIGLPMVGLAN